MKKWLRVQNSNWYTKRIDDDVPRWRKAVEGDGHRAKKKKMKCVVHPSVCAMGMLKEFKEICGSQTCVVRRFGQPSY